MKLKTVKKAVGIIFLGTTAIAIIYTAYAVYTLLKNWLFTSFPWWSAFYFTGIYFGPLLCVEGIAYLLLFFAEKRQKELL